MRRVPAVREPHPQGGRVMETALETKVETRVETALIFGWKHGNEFPAVVSARNPLFFKAIDPLWKQGNTFSRTPPHTPRCARGPDGLARRAGKCVCEGVFPTCRFSRHIEWFLRRAKRAETRAGTVAVGHRVSFGCPVFRLRGTRRGAPRRDRLVEVGESVAPAERTRPGATWREQGATLGQFGRRIKS